MHTDKLTTDTTGIDVVLLVLESGHSVELTATGYSMFPTLRPGDTVIVSPLSEATLPEPGCVIVCMAEVDEWNEEIPHRGSGRRRAEGETRKPQAACRMPHTVFVMHRLVEIKKDDTGNLLLITRGDSMSESDLPWHRDQIIGLVNSYTRDGSKDMIKSRIPHEMEYKINRVLLWLRIKTVASSRRVGTRNDGGGLS